MNKEQKTCQNCKNTFTIEPEDFKFYEKMQVPAPTFCWPCRTQRRFSFRNERNLYKRKSDFSDKEIFSMYSTTSPVKVYEREVWNSDAWDPMEYGKEFNEKTPFLEQVKELLHTVPLKNQNLVGGVNSDYCNHATEPKNSYLIVNAAYPEDCYYGNGINASRDCFDTAHISECENSYELFWCSICSASMFSSHCENSYNMILSKDCSGCNDCFGCVGLRKKSHHIFNKPYTKEEYKKKIASYDLGSYKNLEAMKKKAYAFWSKFPNRHIIGFQNRDVSGNYIDHSKNVKNSFLIREGENMKYCQYAQELPGSKDCYDYSVWGGGNELLYESCSCGLKTNNLKFCLYVQENVRDIEYSLACSSSSNLFGCVGLKKKQYCILNKQYSKEKYQALVKKVKLHMDESPYIDKKGRIYKYGEYFPIEISPLGYNETLAQEYFPLTKKEALERGYNWKDPEPRDYEATVKASDLPDHIKDVNDSIKDELIGCEHAAPPNPPAGGGGCNDNPSNKCGASCTEVFRLVPQELKFYKKMAIPLPRLCPSCRHYARLKQRTLLTLVNRPCQCAGKKDDAGQYQNTVSHFHKEKHCPNNFETAYSKDRPEIIYCENCYRSEFI